MTDERKEGQQIVLENLRWIAASGSKSLSECRQKATDALEALTAQPEPRGDWCDICNAPQYVLPNGDHACGEPRGSEALLDELDERMADAGVQQIPDSVRNWLAAAASPKLDAPRWECPDCGYKDMPYPPKDYHICPKCLVEFGNDDRKTAREYERRNP